MKIKLTFLGLLIMVLISGRTQVTFVVDSLPDYTPPGDILYIAGDFQGWNPGDPDYALQKNAEDKWSITLDSMAQGTDIKFKFTRGDWGKVEKGEFGQEIPDREFTYGNGETVSIIIYNWADGGGSNTTAADNVAVMDDEFYMPQLDRYRKIWIYLPPDYEESDLHYPVIYMHDGQNLFDTYTSFAGEWEVDETLNDLFDEGYKVPIVVGIDNGGSERINEYTPWINPQYGGGNGDLYVSFIVETLKPYIDEHYRTLAYRESTAIWGSSLGGLISQYAAMKHQDVFSKAGLYSPSYWFSDSVWTFTQAMGHQHNMRLYQMTGDDEGGSMVQDTWHMHDTLTLMGFDDTQLSTQINPGGHNEQLWRADFGDAYLWLFHSFANGINEVRTVRPLAIFPNPAHHRILLPADLRRVVSSIALNTVNGSRIMETSGPVETIDVSGLSPGLYLIDVLTDEALYQGKFVKY